MVVPEPPPDVPPLPPQAARRAAVPATPPAPRRERRVKGRIVMKSYSHRRVGDGGVHRCGPGASAPCQFFPRVCPSVASTSPCCTRLPTGSTPLMPLYHRYHLHRFVDGHVLVSPPQGLSVPEPRPSITVGGLAVYGRGHGNSARSEERRVGNECSSPVEMDWREGMQWVVVYVS